MSKIKIKQIRSIIDQPERQKLTIKALGLGRPNWEKIHNDSPQIRGMINKVSHLVTVDEFKEEKPKVRKRTSKKKQETKVEETKEKTEEINPAENKG